MTTPVIPLSNPTVTHSITNASSRVAITGSNERILRVVNPSANTIFLKSGDSTVTAAITDTPVRPGETAIFSLPNNSHTHIAAIAAVAGPSVAYYQVGPARF
jgi:hypothetical protein